MSWASHRKFEYLFGLLLFLALIALAILYPVFTQKPSCFDNSKNGDETGVDCGGSCMRICSSEAAEPIILWSRAFSLVGSSYNLVALVENQNKNAALSSVSYEFKIYDENNLLIGRRDGTTYLPPNKQFAIFESRFDAGQSNIKSVTFEFLPPFVWTKKEPTLDALPIHVDNIVSKGDVSGYNLSARVTNDSQYDLPAFDVVTILYDSDHNAINASKTHKEGLLSNTTTPILFTWPGTLLGDPVTQDIFTQINPFTTPF